jgi:uncharacterized protein
MPFFLRILIFFLGLINLLNKKQLLRLVTMVRFGNTDEQKKVIESMRQYYPEATGIVFLTMDMEYMGAGKPVKKLEQQFEELAALKKTKDYQNVIYPFAFIDPRRIEPRGEEIKIEQQFAGDVFLQKVEAYIKEGSLQGLKIYPALGYYPFDERVKPAYDLAIKYNLPITTHCTIGAVHHKHKIESSKRVHPFKGPLSDLKPVDYQKFFSHPLNYLCLMDQELLKQVWGKDAPDYRNKKFPNLYTDISYTLHDASLLPMLRMMLESNEDVRNHVLFGTDFYMVSKTISERNYSINLRAALGHELFEQIAIVNAREFLKNTIHQPQ